MTEGLHVAQAGAVLEVVFDRPQQRNAMTFAMYEGLHEACERADADESVRVLVLRGAGGQAFVAGTDITQFAGYSGEDGVAYEDRIAWVVNRLEDVSVPTVAVVQGWCVGGGLALAAACDLRVATPSSRFGVPIARTLGNCLSMNSMSLLVTHLGRARTLDLLLRARALTGEEALAAGFVAELADDGVLDERVQQVVDVLLGHAPVTMRVAKQMAVRLRRATMPGGDDLVREAFGSNDFARAVEAFGRGERPPPWQGR